MNLATIRVYVVDSLEEERFLCQAESVERGGQGVALREVVDARRLHRKQVGEKVRERKQTVARYASPKALARRALSRLGSVEKPSQDVSAISETAAPEVSGKTLGAAVSKVRWYDADEGEIALSVVAIPNANDSRTSVPSLPAEPSGSFPSKVRWYDDE